MAHVIIFSLCAEFCGFFVFIFLHTFRIQELTGSLRNYAHCYANVMPFSFLPRSLSLQWLDTFIRNCLCVSFQFRREIDLLCVLMISSAAIIHKAHPLSRIRYCLSSSNNNTNNEKVEFDKERMKQIKKTPNTEKMEREKLIKSPSSI